MQTHMGETLNSDLPRTACTATCFRCRCKKKKVFYQEHAHHPLLGGTSVLLHMLIFEVDVDKTTPKTLHNDANRITARDEEPLHRDRLQKSSAAAEETGTRTLSGQHLENVHPNHQPKAPQRGETTVFGSKTDLFFKG